VLFLNFSGLSNIIKEIARPMFKAPFLVVFAAFLSIAATAQTSATISKVGYADVEYILAQLPSAIQLEQHLKTLEADLVKNYQKNEADFKAKYDEFAKAEKAGTLLPAIRDNTIRELQMMEDNLMKFGQDIEKTLKDREEVLSMPIFKSIGEAIDAVAKENGYTLILNTKASGIAIILSVDPGTNVSDLVLKKLGVTPGVAKTPAASTTPPANTKPTTATPPKKN
jgi:outer membrane protein